MKRKIVYTLCASMALGGFASSKTDLGSRARIRAKKSPVEMVKSRSGEMRMVRRAATRAAADETLRAFITVVPGTVAADLEAAGVTVRSIRGVIALAEFSESLLPDVEALECVVSIKTEAPVMQKMDRVRAVTGVDRIHAAENLPQAYSGKGVIAGVVDAGFDPNHVNFLDENGKTRFKQLNIYRYGQSMSGSQQVEVANIVGDKFDRLDTDAQESFHASHTTGIMAGSYRGKVRAGNAVDFTTGEVVTVDNPYYGIAYDADIVAGAADGGDLTDYFVSLGCESILDYAWEHDQPVVFNLSLGSNVGPHDGSSVMCRYLDAIVEDDQVNTIVCMAAGNEGDLPITLSKVMTADDNKIGAFIHPVYPELGNDDAGFVVNPRSGLIYVYSDTDEPFDIQAQIYNYKRGTVSSRFPLPPAGEEGMAVQYWVSSSEWMNSSDDKVDANLSRYFNGYVGLAGMMDEDAGRYYAVIDITCWDNEETNGDGNYAIAFQITGKDGQRIDVYGDGQMIHFKGNGVNGYSDGGYDGTISDIACGRNTIVVGSYTTRNHWGSLDGNVYGYWDDVIPQDEMSPFTSYGTLVDGRTLPHICAPGAAIISSSNKYYLDVEGVGDESIQARAEANGRTHDFHQSVGTSMSTPVVAGTIALWLEANPELKAADARDILMRTAVKDDVVAGSGHPLQWGAGKLDAYAGLKEVLNSTGVSAITDNGAPRLEVRRSGRQYDILVPGAESVEAKVYSVSGVCVLAVSAKGNEVSVDTSALMPGVYMVKVNNNSIKISIN